MKKIITLIVLLTITSLSYGQLIYNNVIHVDRFHDIIYSVEKKTIISFTDTIITIESKGLNPSDYRILTTQETGSKNNPVNLVNDIWGYESKFLVQQTKTAEIYTLIYRTITYQYTGTYKSNILWVEDTYGNKTIYTTIE